MLCGSTALHHQSILSTLRPLAICPRKQRRLNVVGYFGLIDERCDLDLARMLAQRLPDVTFLLIGPWRVDPQALASLNNVRIVGGVPYAELTAHLEPVSLLLLPSRSRRCGELRLGRGCSETGGPPWIGTSGLPGRRELGRAEG